MIQVTETQYQRLIFKARFYHSTDFMDIAHDSLLKYEDYETAMQKVKQISFEYKIVEHKDYTKYLHCNTCTKCNSIQPASEFLRIQYKGAVYLGNICQEYRRAYKREWNIKNREHIRKYNKECRKRNKVKRKK